MLINADTRYIPLDDKSVHMVCCSPPYWGLRDYGISGQLGLEATPEEYIDNMVAIGREVRRVLRNDGTWWLNLGDSYGTGTTASRKNGSRGLGAATQLAQDAVPRCGGMAKQLVGIPWRVALALQADGWWLRSDIIWHKPNPMPESVTDRPTSAHEHVFLLAKSKKYYYDADAVREETSREYHEGEDFGGFAKKDRLKSVISNQAHAPSLIPAKIPTGRNRRNVWTIATQPYKGAHFATWPMKLVEPMVKAGCPIGGIVFDPFAGSGTTGAVCRQLGRQFIGLDLNAEYLELARERIGKAQPMLEGVG